MTTDDEEYHPKVPRRLIRGLIVIWLFSSAATLFLTGVFLVLIFLVIAGTIRPGH